MNPGRILALVLIAGLCGCGKKEELTPSEKMAVPREACVADIEQTILKIVHDTKDWEYASSRIYLQPDIDGDSVHDAILLTTFGHGNFSRQELFVCLTSSPHHVMHLEVGQWRVRIADQMKVIDGKIVITGKKYGEQDASCCPSLTYTSTFAVTAGRIQETP